jgi:hypothetical protein
MARQCRRSLASIFPASGVERRAAVGRQLVLIETLGCDGGPPRRPDKANRDVHSCGVVSGWPAELAAERPKHGSCLVRPV